MASMSGRPSTRDANWDKTPRKRRGGNNLSVVSSESTYNPSPQSGADTQTATEALENGLLMQRELSHHALISSGTDPSSIDSGDGCQICTDTTREKHVTSRCPYLQSGRDWLAKNRLVIVEVTVVVSVMVFEEEAVDVITTVKAATLHPQGVVRRTSSELR